MLHGKRHRPWKGFEYVVLIVIAIFTALFLLWPLGQEVRDVFQTLVDAFRGK